ncbi:hypothetical protein CALCODRAFT_441680 [Calocera cornea HHB12733]|uniref:CENP-V/GFA domain-containing protein n=1 Tax=Calocera cornea HHB12733 TaxID=1353952 RepID=A0A165D9I3_9BASI|nr:hypothetical protein CALCODRAFT_441680 [Calocera cornea HHB12733]
MFVTCHCRKHRIPIHLDPSALPHTVDFCYCLACRQTTGAPFGCYIPVPHPLFPPPANASTLSADPSSAKGAVPYVDLPESIRTYKTSEAGTRYFCVTCGCHLGMDDFQGKAWCVPEQEIQAVDSTYTISWHQYLSETVDGGLTRILPDGLPRWSLEKDDKPFNTPPAAGPLNAQFRTTSTGEDVLTARCRCGGVRARIRRPSAIPSGPGVKERGSSDGRRWMAGHCVCTDCRLVSGCPLSSWIYVGREHLTIEGETLVYYQSSEKAKRGFCSTCGATVTWDGGQPTVDISTPLFERAEGEGVAAVESDWTYLEDELSYASDGRDTVLRGALSTGMKQNAGQGR